MKGFVLIAVAMATTHATDSQEIRDNIRKLQRVPGGNTIDSVEEYEAPVIEESSFCIQPNCYYPQVFDPINC